MTSMNPIDDVRPLVDRALDQVGALVAVVEPAQAALATPCPDYDVAALVGHLLSVTHRFAVVGEGGDTRSIPVVTTGVPQPSWAERFTKAAAELRSVWSDDALLDRPMRLPWGTVPGRGAMAGALQELTTHSWDLAVALGRTGELDPRLAEVALSIAKRAVPVEGREVMPFGPVVDVPAGADAYQRLAGYLGRPVG